MRGKRKSVIVALALTLGLSGCQLARPDQETAQADRLIGLYVTTEYVDLFNMEDFLEDRLNDGWTGGEITGDTSHYQGRVYAVRDEAGNYSFPGVPEGVNAFWPREEQEDGSLLYASACGLEVLDGGSDLKRLDGGVEQTCRVTLYLDAGRGNAAFFNPVYQTASGEIYLTSGTGMSVYDETSAQATGAFTHTMSDETKVTDSAGAVRTDSFSVEATVEFWTPLDTIAVTQMSGDGRVVRRDVFGGETLPDALPREADTAYYILEETRTEAGETVVERTLTEGDCPALSFVQPGEGPFCVSHAIGLGTE